MAPRRPCELVLHCACLALLVAAAGAMQFRVGGQRGWTVPGAGAEPYNSWAGRLRFQIGDQLLFVYPKETDSVLVVDQGAYDACNTTAYAARFADGATVFTFDRSGPFFFVSGNDSSCRADEKLIVVVLADRSGRAPPAPPASPPSISVPPSGAPTPTPSTSSPPSAEPVPAPAGATPSSAPSPAASAPAPGPATLTPTSSPPSPAALAPSPSSPSPATPGGAAQPPSASGSTPGAEGGNSTTPASSSVSDRGSAATVMAALATSLGACIGYAMLAI